MHRQVRTSAPRRARLSLALAVVALLLPGPAVAGAPPTAARSQPVVFSVTNSAEAGQAREVHGTEFRPARAARTVVLLQHGLSYTGDAWDVPGYSSVRPLVAAGYAVVTIDRLGYGRSRPTGFNGRSVTVPAYADMTRQMIAELRTRYDRVVLGGHSAGAEITLLTAGLHGGADAVLALGYSHFPSAQIATDFFTGDYPRSVQGDYEYFLGTPEHRADMFFTEDAQRRIVEADTAAAQLTPSGEIQTMGAQASRYVTTRISVPLFLQLASEDRLFPAADGPQELALYPAAKNPTLDVVPAAGHTFMLHPSGRPAADRLVTWLLANVSP
jgi:pimeloyl-ACP methyl ester carboxylesterase